MIKINKKKLFQELTEKYIQKHRKSEEAFKRANQFQIRGGSHTLRLFAPFPFYDVRCKGSRVADIDGNEYIDFWQGHYANILGHNPDVIIKPLQDFFQNGEGLITGFPGQLQVLLAELIIRQTGLDRIRFTTSGTLASMYSILLAKSFTKRKLVMKIGGGWHGAQPYTLKGITRFGKGLVLKESAGISRHIDTSTVITRFNDPEDLEDKFRRYGKRLACFIIEPFIGAGGFMFARREYIRKARELTHHYGTLFIFDEVISGFRFLPAGVQSLYQITPDLSLFGKAIGGGLSVSAVAGREDVMRLCDPEAPEDLKVKFEGGTFSAHPASMYAGFLYLKHLIKNADSIYPRIGRMGNKVREEIEKIFTSYGFNVMCTGIDKDITPESSFVGVHFFHKHVDRISSPEDVWNTEKCDVEMREKIFKLAMINEGINIFHGFGAVSSAHTDEDIQRSLDAADRTAQYFLKFKE